ncbi:DUF2231 domain-containing protein [Streptomyces marokkonensis]|uniref:DUF2231 domain-containing protein n=1 Tax=Streptomyces marokkonensis TaxID=324855 RepID=A0ABW6PYR6_9ACTN|nr:DUF2231 domain-containing protein [Streptomyces marokkonensis]
MPDTFLDLPVHPLIVHATVVAVPAAALTVATAALWPRFRGRAGLLPLALSVMALVLVPLTVRSGETLADGVDRTDAVRRHIDLGDGLLPWAVVLTLGAAAQFWATRRETRPRNGQRASVSRPLAVALTLFALTGAGGSGLQVARIGHSGADAVWDTRTAPVPQGAAERITR